MAVFSHTTAAEQMGIVISPGESMTTNLLQPLSPSRENKLRLTDISPTRSHKPSLPPAVASVPPEHIRGYVHNKKVNHYLVGSNLGEGSFAKVKEAFHMMVGEKVAMKVIDKKKALQDPYVAKNFRREAKLLQMVRHPNILQLLEVIETDSSFYLITELCSGGELMKYIYKKGQLCEEETRKFMRQIISAVDHLHRAGIIHRDLKVENMLLDSNMSIRIIDFGLSNEEYIEGENGWNHCTTQCGSPAYAAPELLGHKAYGPQVDIWSIGVNMFAMLTGCLPYTVEPFNITALHAKMLENKMNPIPDHLSAHCKDLLQQLLRPNPDERVKMPHIMSHPWMNTGHSLPFGPAPFPNKLESADINENVVHHMVNTLKLKDNEDELSQELVTNRSTQSGAIYHLLTSRLARYKKQFQSSRVHIRNKPNRVSRDHGYFEGDDDDDHSVASMPARLRKPPNKRQYRPTASKDRPISHPPALDEMSEEEEKKRASAYHYQRRQTMPEMMLKEELSKFQEMHRRKEPSTRNDGTQNGSSRPSKRPFTRQNYSSLDLRNKQIPTSHEASYKQAPQPELGPLAPVHYPAMRRNPYSHPSSINQIRQDLNTKLGIHNTPPVQAWHSNPGSRNPSRQGSRQSSGHMTRRTTTQNSRKSSSYDANDDFGKDELEFHDVESLNNTLPRSNSKKKKVFDIGGSVESIPDSSHLPAITESRSSSITDSDPPSSWKRKRHYSDFSPEKKNDFHMLLRTVEFKTEMGIDAILTEILRVAHIMKVKSVDQNGSNIVCKWSNVKIQVAVTKGDSTCKLMCNCLPGGSSTAFKEKHEKLFKNLRF